MKKAISALLLLFDSYVFAQVNLVPNSSFEILDSCPYLQDQVEFANPWFDASGSSPDLYNRCSSVLSNSVPLNWTGRQEPHSGDGYAGIACYNYAYNGVDNRREYIGVEISMPLIAGKLYCIEFYASRADDSFWATNRLGLCLSLNDLNDWQGDTLNCIPQIEFDTNLIFLDTSNWIRISGSYLALGGERFVTIGNFLSDSKTDTVSQLGNFIWAYYYIDDVSVYEISECIAGNDVSICFRDSIQLGVPEQPNIVYSWLPTTGLNNSNISNPTASPDTTITYTLTQTECDAVSTSTVTVTVNHGCHNAPAIIIPSILYEGQNLFISGLETNSKLELFDDRGRLVYAQESYLNDFWTQGLAVGIYVARLTRPNGDVVQQKVCIVK